jgi:UDP-N-acetylglucosamine 2-epimerase (non-hydrolysing)
MNLVRGAAAVVTDSGGIQEETTYLGIPCLTLRENTERPITITAGTNRLVLTDDLLIALRAATTGGWGVGKPPENWDGRTASRCATALHRRFA